MNVSAADLRNHYACLEDLGQALTGYIAWNYSSISEPAESTSNLKVVWESILLEFLPWEFPMTVRAAVKHITVEETVLRSSKSVLHSCSFFNFVVLVVARLERVEWSQDKETPITVHLFRFPLCYKKQLRFHAHLNLQLPLYPKPQKLCCSFFIINTFWFQPTFRNMIWSSSNTLLIITLITQWQENELLGNKEP